MNDRPLTMPFGKHRGKAFAELDTGYLEWASGQPNFFREEKYKTALLAELERRQAGGQSTQQKPRQPAPPSDGKQGFSLERIKASVFAMKSAYRNSPAKQDVHDALDGLVSLLTEDEIGKSTHSRPAVPAYEDPLEEDQEPEFSF